MAKKLKPVRPLFAEAMTRFRLDSQLTYDDLSRITGIGVSTLKQYASGLRKPGLVGAIKLSKALGWPIDQMAQCREFHNEK